MTKILIEVDTDNEASISDARSTLDKLSGETTAAPAKDKPAASKPSTAMKADKEKAPAKETKKAEGPTEAEKEVLYAPVKTIALKLSKEKGRDVLLSVLGAFDAEKAPDLKVEQYDEFIQAAQNELDT